MNSNPDSDVVRKRLLWRATHRGIKEMDLIIGGFATAHLAGLSEPDLRDFARILELPDQEMLAWVTRVERVPDHLRSPLLDRILAFTPGPAS
jgi:antitoxin CptB